MVALQGRSGHSRFVGTIANNLILYCSKDTAAHYYKYKVTQQLLEQKITNIDMYLGFGLALKYIGNTRIRPRWWTLKKTADINALSC